MLPRPTQIVLVFVGRFICQLLSFPTLTFGPTGEDPIPLPRGRQLVTLEDAGRYIMKLPKAEHEAAEWQAAMEALILVAASGGPTMFARIGVMRALNHRKSDPAITPRRKRAKAIMR
jgi:hypothetical protein